MKPHRSALSLLILAASLATADAQTMPRPGQYEVTLDMNLAIPAEAQKAILDAAGIKKQKRMECITAEDLKGANDMAAWFAREAAEANCKMSDVKSTGNRLTFTTTCQDDDIRMISTTEVTFDGDSFATSTKATDHDGRVSTVKSTAKRVGACRQ